MMLLAVCKLCVLLQRSKVFWVVFLFFCRVNLKNFNEKMSQLILLFLQSFGLEMEFAASLIRVVYGSY